MEQPLVLKLDHIDKDYVTGKIVVPALRDVTLHVEQGEYVAQVHAARWGGRKAADDRWGVERRALLGRVV